MGTPDSRVAPPDSPSASDVRREVARLTASRELVHAERLASLLRFVVEEALSGRASTLKEARIGLEVFGRRAGSYDPAFDPIVRVQMGRLRARLRSHYSREPSDGRIRIEVPVGGYVPTFASIQGYGAGEEAETSPAPDQPRIAVLPFVSVSADPANQYFCDGLTEELINRLATTRGIRVVARTSSFQFKDAARDIREIGRVLDTSLVLEGSVRQTGGRVRVTVQLIKTADGCHVWSDRYEGDLTDLFAIHEQIATAIQQALRRHLLGPPPPVAPRPAGLEPYNHYLQGRFLWNRRTEHGLRAALEHFDRAVQLDASFARALSGKADCYLMLGMSAAEPPDITMPAAAEAAERALALDGGLAEAHTSLAAVRNCYDWDWAAAEEGYRRALALDASYATALHWLGLFYQAARGNLTESVELLEAAIDLDPLASPIIADLGLVHAFRRNVGPAAMHCRHALELDPNFHRSFWFLGLALAWSGDLAAAERELTRGLEVCPGSAFRTRLLGALGFVYGQRGDRRRARKLVTELEGGRQSSYVPLFELAQIAAGAGERDRALALLEDAVARRETFGIFLGVWPSFRDLHGDARFRALLSAIGLLP